MQTFAPGVSTPIHRHDCEEVFLVLKGGGSFLLGSVYVQGEGVSEGGQSGGPFEEHRVQGNSTFTVPRNAVHQVGGHAAGLVQEGDGGGEVETLGVFSFV